MPWFLTATNPTSSYALPSLETKAAFCGAVPAKSARSTTGIAIDGILLRTYLFPINRNMAEDLFGDRPVEGWRIVQLVDKGQPLFVVQHVAQPGQVRRLGSRIADNGIDLFDVAVPGMRTDRVVGLVRIVIVRNGLPEAVQRDMIPSGEIARIPDIFEVAGGYEGGGGIGAHARGEVLVILHLLREEFDIARHDPVLHARRENRCAFDRGAGLEA